MQVDFYQLSRDPVARVLPMVAARVVESGARLLVVHADAAARAALSQGLWDAPGFLAHGEAGGAGEGVQPILLAPDLGEEPVSENEAGYEAANGARHVALADGVWRDAALGFERAFLFFDAAGIDGARDAWRMLAKRDDVTPRFWKQDGGRWVQGP